MQKTKGRILCLLLALIMSLSLLPTAALAAGTTVSEYFSDLPLEADPGPGTTQWVVDGENVKSGNSGKASSTSTLKLTFTQDTAISFEYKVSSEARYDTCTITLGTTEIAKGSGEVDWTGCTVEVKEGETLTVIYSKDGSGNDGDDCVYLRNFSCSAPLVITFHDGTSTDTQNIYGGSGELKGNPFTQTGKVFAGWSLSEGGEVVYADKAEITVTQNIDLYAIWADAYTVTFDNNGDENTVDVAQNYAIGAANLPDDPIRTGYSFCGWFNGTEQLTADTVISGNVTYTAKWTPVTYIIEFDSNGGEGSMDAVTAVYDLETDLPESTLTRAGYKFLGWNIYSTSSTEKYDDGATVKNLKNAQDAVQTLYAVWTGLPVDVTIDLNYETDERETSRTCVVGENYNCIYNEETGKGEYDYNRVLKDPVRTGYIFNGWFDAAEGGNQVTNQYKFTVSDEERGKTLYAQWTKGITVHYDGNGYTRDISDNTVTADRVYSSLPSLSSYYYPSNKVLDGWYTEKEGGEKVTADTVFTGDEVTLYAHWRDYQYIVKFNVKYSDKNFVTGAMADIAVPFGVDYQLPACTLEREGYEFKGWSESSYSAAIAYANGATINREFIDDYWYGSEDGESFNLYAVWEQTVFGKAYDAIAGALPTDNIVQTVGSLNLPVSGEGYTIAYSSSDPVYVDDTANVVRLPDSGTVTIRLTATVTDTESGKTQSKDYTFVLYSQQALDTKAELEEAAAALGKNFTPVYGTDTNANRAVETLLKGKGFDEITVSVKEAATHSNGYASIDQDGTIHYYYNPAMSGSSAYFYVTFLLTKNDVSVEKTLYASIGWDEERVRQTLEAELERVTLPEEPITELSLPQYPPKEGCDPKEDGYDYSTQNTWATITWTSSDDRIIEIKDAPYYPYYSPYSTTVTRSAVEQSAVLTATIRCNSVSGVEVTKEYNVAVQRISEAEESAVRDALQAKLDAGMAAPGLTDYVTGTALDTDNVVNDIKFPTTREFGIDGKYYPVTITSSNTNVIETPNVNNAARVWVYRPLPGQVAEEVDLTIRITEESSGIYAEKTVTVTVQPLTDKEIDDEIQLMERVKAGYFDGIKNANTDPNDIKTDLHAFQEAYLNEEGELVWVYDIKDRAGYGIVPVEIDGWETLEQWRVFRSSNAAVITHENLLVTRQTESKYVTITSYLSSETLGKYAEKYPDDERLQKLYYQPVSVTLIVTGTAPSSSTPVEEKLTVSFTLQDSNSTLIPAVTISDLPEGSTAFDVFLKVMADNGYSYLARGSYIYAITTPDGRTIEELDEGDKSGWMYSVNGIVPSVYLAAYTLNNNDNIIMFFTKDYTKENWILTEEETTEKQTFDDIEGHWAKEAIEYVCENKIFQGVSETLFSPDSTMNRAMLVTALYRLEGEPAVHAQPSFTDVKDDMWYTNAVAWAAENSIAEGVGGGIFAPLEDVTREQISAILMRYARYKGYDISKTNELTSYIDADKISSWALETMKWANAEKLITGRTENTLVPGGKATRAEVAAVVMRFMENTAKK